MLECLNVEMLEYLYFLNDLHDYELCAVKSTVISELKQITTKNKQTEQVNVGIGQSQCLNALSGNRS